MLRLLPRQLLVGQRMCSTISKYNEERFEILTVVVTCSTMETTNIYTIKSK